MVDASSSFYGDDLPVPLVPTVATHWGTYRARRFTDNTGETSYDLHSWDGDPAPSHLIDGVVNARRHPTRILKPCVRKSFLDQGGVDRRFRRGAEKFVEVEWDVALDLVARELERVRGKHGNGAIFGGSYGWSSAGRFHHAQSQVHRFLNCLGGYVRSVRNYSFAAGDVILPHVIGSSRGLGTGQTPWRLIAGEAKLLVMFGGAPLRNAQVSSGGIARHGTASALLECRSKGMRFVNVSPIRDDVLAELDAEWLALRPNTDTALMLGLAYTLISEDRHDQVFLDRATTGFSELRRYIMGEADGIAKTPAWASAITGLPANDIANLARRMARQKTFIMVSWSLQRARHGEQPYWMAIALAAMLGGIGLPGQGFGFGYASSGAIGAMPNPFGWPSLPQGTNAVEDFIPVARIADMLLHSGKPYDYNGDRRAYPDIKLVYWAGGNPFHHHQDLNRLVEAWQAPETIIVHEPFWNAHARHADIVLPAATMLERNDIACSSRDRFIAASHRLFAPLGEARTDFDIFCDLATRLEVGSAFSGGRDEAAWIRALYAEADEAARKHGHSLPAFEQFWQDGLAEIPESDAGVPLLAAFRNDPAAHRLSTPSGLIELASSRIASFGYDDCPGHPSWLAPEEWLGAATEAAPLHLLSNQPAFRLHSQYDHVGQSQANKMDGREPLRLNTSDAAARGIKTGDTVRVFNMRGSLFATAEVSDALRLGVAQMATGAWYDPTDADEPGSPCKSGNPNVLTQDNGTSKLSQGPNANSCLVQVALHDQAPPIVTCYIPPEIERSLARETDTNAKP